MQTKKIHKRLTKKKEVAGEAESSGEAEPGYVPLSKVLNISWALNCLCLGQLGNQFAPRIVQKLGGRQTCASPMLAPNTRLLRAVPLGTGQPPPQGKYGFNSTALLWQTFRSITGSQIWPL